MRVDQSLKPLLERRMDLVSLQRLHQPSLMDHTSLMQLLPILQGIRVFSLLNSPLSLIRQKEIRVSLHDQLLVPLSPVKVQSLPLLVQMLHTRTQPITNVVLMLEHGQHVFQLDLPQPDLPMQHIPFHSVVLIPLEIQKPLQQVLPLR